MKIYRLAANLSDLILPNGTVLYHGTCEEYDYQQARGGGYDNVFWTAESKAIAKTYIPISGGSLSTDTRSILRPSKNPSTINIQKALGVSYDSTSFTYRKDNPNELQSWRPPDVFLQEQKYHNGEEERCEYVNKKMEEVFGYKAQGSGCGAYWRIKMHFSVPQKADYVMEGKLLSLTLRRDFRIWDKTGGGAIEGDLMDVDYHQVGLFRTIESKGYDGIKINDFCQSEDYGNVGHTSIGLFKHALPDVSIATEPAHHELLEPYFKGVKNW